jgi:hypothetical protein
MVRIACLDALSLLTSMMLIRYAVSFLFMSLAVPRATATAFAAGPHQHYAPNGEEPGSNPMGHQKCNRTSRPLSWVGPVTMAAPPALAAALPETADASLIA